MKADDKQAFIKFLWIITGIVSCIAIFDIAFTQAGVSVGALRFFSIAQSLAVLIYSISKIK